METRILVVDDESHTREILGRLLESEGYVVRTSGSVSEALTLASVQPPDLVIADVSMPGGSGLDLASRLPEACGLRVPVLLLSGLGAEEDILAGFDSGACDYICKPWRDDELLAKVHLHIRRRAAAVANQRNQPIRTIGDGRVRLGRQIGVGGMGSVFRGEDTRLGRDVAVKILRPDLAADRAYVTRFLQEARVLSRLDLPGIPRVHDVGREGDLYYYVMDLMEGETLRERVKRAGPLDHEEIAELGLGVAQILEALEGEQVLHRDIKPDNILLRADGTVSLVDFGLARGFNDARLTDPSQVVGTAGYLAPEQLVGATLPDVRCDLYSLGMTLWFGAVGQDHRVGESSARMRAALTAGAVELGPIMPDAPRSLVALVRSLTERDPNHRPRSARRARIVLSRVQRELQGRSVDALARAS